MFVYVDPGHDTSTALRSCGAAHRGLWHALQGQGRSVEVATVARTSRELERARRVMRGWAEASGPGEPDAGIREELARIERAMLQGAVQILEEFGGLQAAMKRRRRAREAGAPPARTRVHPAGQHLADGASRGGALPMTGARLTAALECANDAGGRCALWPSGDAHACYGVSHDTATSCAFAAGSVSAARAALTGTGATPQAEGLLRARTQVCFHTPAPVPWGRSQSMDPLAGRPSSAAVSGVSTDRSGFRVSALVGQVRGPVEGQAVHGAEAWGLDRAPRRSTNARWLRPFGLVGHRVIVLAPSILHVPYKVN